MFNKWYSSINHVVLLCAIVTSVARNLPSIDLEIVLASIVAEHLIIIIDDGA